MSRRTSVMLSVMLSVLAVVGCARGDEGVQVTGALTWGGGRPLPGIPVLAIHRSADGTPHRMGTTTDPSGRFTLPLPASQLVHVQARYGEFDLLDHDLVTPPSGTFVINHVIDTLMRVQVPDSTSEWGRAFRAFEAGNLLAWGRLILLPDSVADGAMRDSLANTLLDTWRETRVPMIRQALAASTISRLPRRVSPADAAVMLRELDPSSSVYNTIPFPVVLSRARHRALAAALPDGAIPYDTAFQLGLRAAMDAVLANPRATASVRATVMVSLARALQTSGDTAAARRLRESAQQAFPRLLASMPITPPASPTAPLPAPEPLREFTARSVPGNRAEALGPKRLRARYTLLDFWATWCASCISELPTIRAAYAARSREAFDVIGISLDTDPLALRHFQASQAPIQWRQWRLPQGLDDPAAQELGIASLPSTVLVNAQWQVVARGAALRGEALEQTLVALERRRGAASP